MDSGSTPDYSRKKVLDSYVRLVLSSVTMVKKTEDSTDLVASEIKEELMVQIAEAISHVRDKKEGLGLSSLTRHSPEKVAEILYLVATGNSQTRLVKKYKYNRQTVISVLADYADYVGKFRELSGKLAARNYLALSSLEEDMAANLSERMDAGELDVTFRDLKELSIAKANAGREAFTARGEATSIVQNQGATQEQLDATIDRIKAKMALKKAESIDV
jgi:hypothetical protein